MHNAKRNYRDRINAEIAKIRWRIVKLIKMAKIRECAKNSGVACRSGLGNPSLIPCHRDRYPGSRNSYIKKRGLIPSLFYRPISRKKSAIFSLSLLSLLLFVLGTASKSLSALSRSIWISSSGSLPTIVATVSAFSLMIWK